jgi:heme exporter protein D
MRWTDHGRNEEVLLRVKEHGNILHEISKRKANWIGHILRRNCLLQQVIEGKKRRDRSDRKTRKKT